MQQEFQATELLWALGSLCGLHQRNFSAELLAREFPPVRVGASAAPNAPPSYPESTLLHAAARLGFRVKRITLQAHDCASLPLPMLIQTTSPGNKTADLAFDAEQNHPIAPGIHEKLAINLIANKKVTTNVSTPASRHLALITAANAEGIVIFNPDSNEPETLSPSALGARLTGTAWLFALEPEAMQESTSSDPPTLAASTAVFNFHWFVPELLRHKAVWRDVLLASLALQLVTLATPLFTQAIIDKVVVHRTQSTLVAIGIAMGLLTVFSSLLGWGRQYLVLHTGNRIWSTSVRGKTSPQHCIWSKSSRWIGASTRIP
jgi:subfamily B ATP-binding cassette protein HlyB/CyaB